MRYMWYGWHTYGMRREEEEPKKKINGQESSHMIDKGHIENI